MINLKKRLFVLFCFAAIFAALYFPYAFLAFNKYSEKETTIDIPENLKYFFSEYDLNSFEKVDEIEMPYTLGTGEKIQSVREYFQNEKTDERLIRISNKDNGKFLKGYYLSSYCGCVYYDDKTMKLFGKNTDKIYFFKNSKLKYISKTKICKRLYSSVYVITYFDENAKRIALETQTAYLNGNVRAVRFLYNRHYTENFLPQSRRRFEKSLYS